MTARCARDSAAIISRSDSGVGSIFADNFYNASLILHKALPIGAVRIYVVSEDTLTQYNQKESYLLFVYAAFLHKICRI